ncbi:hypothetical protein M407DRAFT_26637 [Tulasnella calospora MUT 4182]|uniref:HSF-type DNA-binding domain-containing protein n=1 Tax=Tulasnella calospora MUT 4182 TaxID=1051891 RepID=A0A0C3QDY9_9AGAM|nr:hypothetical protein M407DRAFT_26637 [Tulasnella calospora MUT 4182]
MSPKQALDVFSFSTAQPPNPSASHTPSSRLDLKPSAGCMLGAQGLREVGEAQYSRQNAPNARQWAMEEESTEQNADATPAFSPVPLRDGIRSDHHREQKHPSGKQFPFKVYDMLEDEAMMRYARWIKSGHRDAFLIPDIDAFLANVMPKHFKEMNQWASFQKQLNNYGFEKQDRGAGKALYAHLENKFRKGRPDLLPQVLRRPHWPTNACMRQDLSPANKRPSTPITPTAPQLESHIYPNRKEIQIETRKFLEAKILELGRELESSKTTQSMMENRLQATESRLRVVEHQLYELLKRLQGTPDYDFFHDEATEVTVTPGASLTESSLQSVLFESHLTKESAPGVFDDAVEAGVGAFESLPGPSQSLSSGSNPTTESTLGVFHHLSAGFVGGLHTELNVTGSLHGSSSEFYLATEMAYEGLHTHNTASQVQSVPPEYHLETGPALNSMVPTLR